MKKLTILALAFVLTAGVLAGCRGNVNTDTTGTGTQATTKPTTATTATTTPSTAATVPSTTATNPSSSKSGMLSDGMIDDNGDAGRANRVH